MASKIAYNENQRVKLIELPVIRDNRGSLTPIELEYDIPFEVKSVRWTKGRSLENAFKYLEEEVSNKIILILSGFVEITSDTDSYLLDKPNVGLVISKGTNVKLARQSRDIICLILSDTEAPKGDGGIQSNELKPNNYSIDECLTIDMDYKGVDGLCSAANTPFAIKRIFYIYDVPNGVERGGHMHKSCHEVLIALNGAFSVELNDGANNSIVDLNDASSGLFLPAGIWAKQTSYIDGALCLVFASEAYDAAGYIDDYDDFVTYRKNENTSI